MQEPTIREFRIVQTTPQAGAQIDKEIIFMIAWGYQKVIMDKRRGNQPKALSLSGKL